MGACLRNEAKPAFDTLANNPSVHPPSHPSDLLPHGDTLRDHSHRHTHTPTQPSARDTSQIHTVLQA